MNVSTTVGVASSRSDYSEAPEITPEIFAKAMVRHGLKPPLRKQQITIRLDDDVLKWFYA